MSDLLQTYLLDLDKFFAGGNSWQGALYQQVEGLTLEQALWKPSPDRHSAWDVLLHINFWKQYSIALARQTEKPDADSGNWSAPPQNPNESDWKKELARTKTVHEELTNAIKELGEKLFDSEIKVSNYVRQIIYHDAYHAGQIGLLRVMQGLKPIE